MRFVDLVSLILYNLGRRKGRVLLTAIGVVIGTAAVVVLVSLAVGLQKNATESLWGISDLTSKRLTTDIPYEELYVHSGKPIEEMWRQGLERSPIYWAHQSETAVLIVGGAADPRVHPGQSLEFYRLLEMHDHPAARLVQYPGEGHGNAKQPGRADVLLRQLDWFDWYVRDAKPLGGELPPLDLGDRYGIEFEKE